MTEATIAPGPPHIAQVEQALLALAPALVERRSHGLLLRSARGLLPAANSAVPGLPGASAEPAAQRRAAEQFFATQQQPTQWLIGQRPANAGLTALLRSADYDRVETRIIWLRARRASAGPMPTRSAVTVRQEPDLRIFAERYGALAGQAGPALRLQTLRLQALQHHHPVALLTVNRNEAAGAPVDGCLLAMVAPLARIERPAEDAESSGRIGLLSDLLVAPHARRAGLGSALLAAADTWFARHNCGSVALESAKNNHAAHQLYQRQGFARAGRWSFYRRPADPGTASAAVT
ncbi:MAG: GNAT family N-acetyltransferase [Pseudomonadota bacterium]